MANTKSARKATRQIARRTEVNKSRRTALRGSVRRVEEAIASGDRNAALTAFKEAEPAIIRSAQRGTVHKNIVSPSSANEHAAGARFKLISNCRARRDAGLFLAEFAPFAAHAAPVAELSIACCKILFHSLRRRRTRDRRSCRPMPSALLTTGYAGIRAEIFSPR